MEPGNLKIFERGFVIGRYPPGYVAFPDTAVLEVMRGFNTRSVRYAPVVKADRSLEGVVSYREIFNLFIEDGDVAFKLRNVKAGNLLRRDLPRVVAHRTTANELLEMLEKGIGVLPVVDEKDKVIGQISERHAVDMLSLAGVTGVKVDELMTRNPITIEAGSTLEEALARMIERNVRRLPVVYNSELVGIVQVEDIIHYLVLYEEQLLLGKVKRMLSERLWRIMPPLLVTVPPGTDLANALIRMRNDGVSYVLVADDEELKGIVTERDIVTRLPKILGKKRMLELLTYSKVV